MTHPSLFPSLSALPIKLSRSKLELFIECPCCFWLDRKHGVCRPSGPGYSLNNTVDLLLKREFDRYRKAGEPHPLMREKGIDAVPFDHPDLEAWRTNSRGVQFWHETTNILLTGSVDDIWVTTDGQLHVVDYKATSTERELALSGGYMRQIEVYQWLLRKNGFNVSDIAYFVYANAIRDRVGFDAKLEFDLSILPHRGSDRWVEQALMDAARVLESDEPPAEKEGCEWCAYRKYVAR